MGGLRTFVRALRKITVRSPNLRQSRIDFRQHRRRPELRSDPPRLGQMLNGERARFFDLVEQTQDHLSAAYMMPMKVEMRIPKDARD